MTVVWFAANEDGDEVHVFKEENMGPNSAAQHLCLEVDDIEAYKSRLREHGYEVGFPRRSTTGPASSSAIRSTTSSSWSRFADNTCSSQLRGSGPLHAARPSSPAHWRRIPWLSPKRSPTPRPPSRSSRCMPPSTPPSRNFGASSVRPTRCSSTAKSAPAPTRLKSARRPTTRSSSAASPPAPRPMSTTR